nr:hypothetical protein [Corynebacterium argentoratense]
MSSELGFGLRPATIVDCEPALDFIKREVINEARHPILMDVPSIGVLTNVGAILEHLVEILRREPVSARCTDSLGVQLVTDFLHGHARGVIVEDLRDDGSRLRARDVALVLVHSETEDLVAVGKSSLGVIALTSSDVG